MKIDKFADYFLGVGVKRLSAVDAELKVSNLYEIGTTKKMRGGFLGEEHSREFDAEFCAWSGESNEPIMYSGKASHYDAQANLPKSSPKWKLSFPSNPITADMNAGDTLFLALRPSGRLLFIVTEAGSTRENQLFWLFGLQPSGTSLVSRRIAGPIPKPNFAARSILAELGIKYREPDAYTIAEIMEPYRYTHPNPAQLSRIARESLPEIDAKDDPDAALMAWLNRTQALFSYFEKNIVSAELEQIFCNDEDFDMEQYFSHAMNTQDRRDSYLRKSLDNHIAAVLDANDLAYVSQPVTENDYKPDFIFPGLEAYRSALAGDPSLTFLGAKSTCKDVWREIIPEAEKIPNKHLLTLEWGISQKETNQMAAASVQLVIPKENHSSFNNEQIDSLMTFRDFIEEVQRRSKLSR